MAEKKKKGLGKKAWLALAAAIPLLFLGGKKLFGGGKPKGCSSGGCRSGGGGQGGGISPCGVKGCPVSERVIEGKPVPQSMAEPEPVKEADKMPEEREAAAVEQVQKPMEEAPAVDPIAQQRGDMLNEKPYSPLDAPEAIIQDQAPIDPPADPAVLTDPVAPMKELTEQADLAGTPLEPLTDSMEGLSVAETIDNGGLGAPMADAGPEMMDEDFYNRMMGGY